MIKRGANGVIYLGPPIHAELPIVEPEVKKEFIEQIQNLNLDSEVKETLERNLTPKVLPKRGKKKWQKK